MTGPGPAGEQTERNIVVTGPGQVVIRDEPRAPVPPGGFRVTTMFSGISAGTELSYVKGTNPFLRQDWDPDLGLFMPGEPDASYPVTRLGYMEVGQVAESRTPAVPAGGIVAMTYGHRTGYTGDPVTDRVVPLPEDLDPLLGIYVAHMGPICANGLLHAAADLCGPDVRSLGDGVRGRRVAVTGAGVVALLTALLARRHGAASVVVLDPDPGRRAAAGALGLESLDPEGPNDPVASLKTRWRHAPGDRGADVVFQCRGQPAALHLALRLARPQATVIDLAFYQGEAAGLRLGAEFHHNGLAVRCAQIGRVPRGLSHTWDRERLSAETAGLLLADGTAIREHLITAVVPFEDAPGLFADLAARRRHELQAVLAFDADGESKPGGPGHAATDPNAGPRGQGHAPAGARSTVPRSGSCLS
jgi:threonine dehydrogenase-like Zn-dependent dehydrogenase